MSGIALQQRATERPFIRAAGGVQLVGGGRERERDAGRMHEGRGRDGWPPERGAETFDPRAPRRAQRVVDVDVDDVQCYSDRRQERVLAREAA